MVFHKVEFICNNQFSILIKFNYMIWFKFKWQINLIYIFKKDKIQFVQSVFFLKLDEYLKKFNFNIILNQKVHNESTNFGKKINLGIEISSN